MVTLLVILLGITVICALNWEYWQRRARRAESRKEEAERAMLEMSADLALILRMSKRP